MELSKELEKFWLDAPKTHIGLSGNRTQVT